MTLQKNQSSYKQRIFFHSTAVKQAEKLTIYINDD